MACFMPVLLCCFIVLVALCWLRCVALFVITTTTKIINQYCVATSIQEVVLKFQSQRAVRNNSLPISSELSLLVSILVLQLLDLLCKRRFFLPRFVNSLYVYEIVCYHGMGVTMNTELFFSAL